jgi:hypothetical protein
MDTIYELDTINIEHLILGKIEDIQKKIKSRVKESSIFIQQIGKV